MLLPFISDELEVYFGHYKDSRAAASIDADGYVWLMGYASNKPWSYPKTGSVISSGTSTMMFLQALGVIMNVPGFYLTDSSKVGGCELPLAIARIAVGRDTWYESFGFTVEEPDDQDFREKLGPELQDMPLLVDASKLMLNQRHDPSPQLSKAVNVLVNRADLAALIKKFQGVQYEKPNPGRDFLENWRSLWGANLKRRWA